VVICMVRGKCDHVPPVMRKTRPDWSGMSLLGLKEASDILGIVIWISWESDE
jgi:hypothetical protein